MAGSNSPTMPRLEISLSQTVSSSLNRGMYGSHEVQGLAVLLHTLLPYFQSDSLLALRHQLVHLRFLLFVRPSYGRLYRCLGGLRGAFFGVRPVLSALLSL